MVETKTHTMYKGNDPGLVDKRKGRAVITARSRRPAMPRKGYVSRNDRPMPVTPKDYEMRVRLIRLFELLQLNVPVAQIAKLFKKPESTIRSWIKQLTDDFSSLIQTDEARNIIAENIAGWELVKMKALTILTTTNEGDARKLQAAQVVADIIKKKADYEVTVGRVKKAPDDLRLSGRMGINTNQADLDALSGEISMSDLKALFITVGMEFREQEERIANAVVVDAPALENGSDNGKGDATKD